MRTYFYVLSNASLIYEDFFYTWFFLWAKINCSYLCEYNGSKILSHLVSIIVLRSRVFIAIIQWHLWIMDSSSDNFLQKYLMCTISFLHAKYLPFTADSYFNSLGCFWACPCYPLLVNYFSWINGRLQV